MSKTKVVILPQYGQRNVIDYSYQNVQLYVQKYFSLEQKDIRHLHMLTHA